MRKKIVPTLLGSLAILLGVEVVIGWMLKNPAMVRVIPGSVVMGLNTALFFIALGSVLVLEQWRPKYNRIIKILCGIVITGATLILIEHFFDSSLGIDWTELHQTIQVGNRRAGRTAQNACICFLLMALFYLLKDEFSAQNRIRCMHILCIITLVLSVMGFAGYALHLELLFEWYEYHRIALPSAIGIILLSSGIYFRESEQEADESDGDINRSNREKDGNRIIAVGSVLLIIMGLAVGASEFIIFRTQFSEAFNQQLSAILKSRVDVFETHLEYGISQAYLFGTHREMAEQMKMLHQHPDHAKTKAALIKSANSFMAQGFSSLRFYHPNGTPLLLLGKPFSNSTMQVELSAPTRTQLHWAGQFVLRSHASILDENGYVAGLIIADYPLGKLTRSFYDIQEIGKSAEASVCKAMPVNKMQCFPRLSSGNGFTVGIFERGQLLPMALALQGEAGVKTISYYLGEKAVTAYSPVGTLGIAMTLKMDSEELYAPIRERLKIVLVVLMGLLGIGSIILRLCVKPLVNRLVESEQKMAYLAHHDMLTGLANRALFHDRLNHAMARSHRYAEMIALLYLDIDHFKSINDTLGHAAGDELLKKFADRLCKSVRGSDTVTRLGGDEFTVIMENITRRSDAEAVANKILMLMKEPFELGGNHHSITSSIGIAYFKAQNMSSDEFVRHADAALYKAKRAGRNCFEIEST